MIDFEHIDRQLDDWITAHSGEIIEKAQGLIRIPSVLGDTIPGAPYGAETRRALDYVIDLAHRYGLRTKMFDGHAAHAEFGSGDRLIGVLSHVDVVPEGQDWTYPAFGGVVDDGKLFGRGAIDDKGPCIASLYGMFAVKEIGVEAHSRVRAIVGADEETGFRCVDYYFAHEEMPVVGFTPDGSFPAIFAEKGIAVPALQSRMPTVEGDVRLVAIRGGERSNMVPDRAVATLAGSAESLKAAADTVEAHGVSTEMSGDKLTVRSVGVSAHASHADKGVNAVKVLADALLGSGVLPTCQEWLTNLRNLAADTTGGILGIAGKDDVCGELTCNLGVLETRGNLVNARFSIRYPVTWAGDDVKTRVTEAANGLGYSLVDWDDSPPLYVPEDDELVQTLLEVYRKQTGDMRPPKTMGGGTYARSLKKGIAFGPDFPGAPDVAHKADEHWRVDELILATRIYAKAIARLACAES